jgi:hypothetical protein
MLFRTVMKETEQLAAACGPGELDKLMKMSKEMLKKCPRVDGPKVRNEPGDFLCTGGHSWLRCVCILEIVSFRHRRLPLY